MCIALWDSVIVIVKKKSVNWNKAEIKYIKKLMKNYIQIRNVALATNWNKYKY